MKARSAITVDRPLLDVFPALAAALAAPPVLDVQPDSFTLEARTTNALVAVAAERGGEKLTVRYVFASAGSGTTVECAYEVASRSMLASLVAGADATKFLAAWMQQDLQRISHALREMVKAEGERERAAQPAAAPAGSTAEPRHVVRRLNIKWKVQVPRGVTLDASRVDPDAGA